MPTEAGKRCPKPRTTMVPGSGPAAHAGVLHAHHRAAAKGAESGATTVEDGGPGPTGRSLRRTTGRPAASRTTPPPAPPRCPAAARRDARPALAAASSEARRSPSGPETGPQSTAGLQRRLRSEEAEHRSRRRLARVAGRPRPHAAALPSKPRRRHRRCPPPTSARRKRPAATITGHRLELLSGVTSGGGEDGG